jgi:hypothetical protein
MNVISLCGEFTIENKNNFLSVTRILYMGTYDNLIDNMNKYPELISCFFDVVIKNNLYETLFNISYDRIVSIIKENGILLEFIKDVKDQTDELCLIAIEENYNAFKFIIDKNENICLKAIDINPHVLTYIDNQTTEMCLKAIAIDPSVFKYVKNQSEEICSFALRKNPYLLEYIVDQTIEQCLLVINDTDCDPDIIYHIHIDDVHIYYEMVKINCYSLKKLNNDIIYNEYDDNNISLILIFFNISSDAL